MVSNKISKESILILVIELLNSHNINYWVTDGTLLGIIRENRLLPWDSDIDIGLWKSEVSRLKIIDIFENHGFKYVQALPKMDCLYFFIHDTQIDISLYSKDDKEASIWWVTNPNKIIDRFIVQIISMVFEKHKKTINFYIKRQFDLRSLIKTIVGLFSHLITNSIKEKIYTFAQTKYVRIGCIYPIELLRFKTIIFKDTKMVVPLDSEEYLRTEYGEDWRISNQDYVWEEDTPNLKVFKD